MQTQNSTGSDRHRRLRIVLMLSGFVVLVTSAWLGWRTNSTADNDSIGVENTFRLILEGTYQPSRTSGFPAYEFLGAGVWAVGGRSGVMALSAGFAILAMVLLIRPMRVLRNWTGMLCWWLLLVTPIVLTNASAVMETTLLFAEIAALAWLLSTRSPGRPLFLLALLAVGILLTTTRPDAFLLSTATALAIIGSRFKSGIKIPSAVLLIGGSMIGLGAVFLISKSQPFQSQFLPSESTFRQILRGAVSTVTAFSPLGAFALACLIGIAVYMVVTAFRRAQISSESPQTYLDDDRFVALWLLATLFFYGIRFLILSDEIEYLLPLVVVIATVAPALYRTHRMASVVAVLTVAGMASTTFITASLLQRSNPWDREPSPRLSLQQGGFFQDLQVREANSARERDEYDEFVRVSAPSLAVSIDSGETVLLPRDTWNYVLNPGYIKYFTQATQVASCEELTTGSLIPGWRLSQPMGEFKDVEAFHRNDLMRCSVVAQLSESTVTPVGNGIVVDTPPSISR